MSTDPISSNSVPVENTGNRQIPYRTLGHTGEKVSCVGMGGFQLGQASIGESDASNLIHSAIDRGINFLDNSWDYNKGESEKRMGKALKQDGYRSRAFLMTKVDGRTKDSASKQIDESLRRLKTDHVDLPNFMRLSASTMRIASSPKGALSKRFWMQRKRARLAISASQATKIRESIFICSKWRSVTDFFLLPYRCRLT